MQKATNAQVKFTLHILHKLLSELLLACYNDAQDINCRNMLHVQTVLDKMHHLCYVTRTAVTVQECVDYLQHWKHDAQLNTMLAVLQRECKTDNVLLAVMQNA